MSPFILQQIRLYGPFKLDLLWHEIQLLKRTTKMEGLPKTLKELRTMLDQAEVDGVLEETKEGWKAVAKVAEVREVQRSLF